MLTDDELWEKCKQGGPLTSNDLGIASNKSPFYYTEGIPIKETIMEDNKTMKEKQQVVIDYFEIPEDMAKELSDLLTKQTIRERMLLNLITEPEKYEQAEEMLVPITARIEAIKIKITKEFVPAKYNSTRFMWNYDGWEVDKNKVQIIEEK